MQPLTVRHDFLFLAIVIAATSLYGQEIPDQITVIGSGTASAKPDTLEISGTISGEAELAGDAVTKFRTAKEDAMSALKELNIEGFTVKAQGYSVGPGYSQEEGFVQGVQDQTPLVAIREQLQIRFTGIDKRDPSELLNLFTKVIDAGKESGIDFGESEDNYNFGYGGYVPSYVVFSVTDQKKLKRTAMQEALRNAKEDASEIAMLSGGKLGPVSSVSSHDMIDVYPAAFGDGSVQNGSSHSFREIEVNVSLTVQFAYQISD